MATPLRVFISSPGDVRDAREVVARTVEKVAPDYLRHFELEPYLWETEALLASGTFQDAIEPPSHFDIVTLIMWSRLGTYLPEKTAKRSYTGIDGRSPVTGTEWEYEDALRAAQTTGVPDLLVYRSRRQVQVDAWDAERRDAELAQLAALDAFWRRHFADRGTFIGAYHEFVDLEDLAVVFETHLRKRMDHRAAALSAPSGGNIRARVWTRPPFRGLEAFEYEHAPIFFGRDEAVGRALGRLIDNAAAGRAFLLVLGASGSGKSSLASAGLAPRLGVPRRVVGEAFLRRTTFQPGKLHNGEDIFGGLAGTLLSGDGRTKGLPELGDRDRLAQLLREGPEHAPAIFEHVLDELTHEHRATGALLPNERAVMLLVVDQLEELFTAEGISADDRRRFVLLLNALARSGRVWVIATMRADMWHCATETPTLVELAEGTGRFDLLPPSPAELSQMIRLPAEAAGLTFEHSAVDGVPLNDRIAEEAAHAPGALPLLSYLLEQLYQTDAVDQGQRMLSYATYRGLGGLRGAIAARAETVLGEQPEAVRSALRSVLFSLVQITADASGGSTMTARRTPMTDFRAGSPASALVEAFLDERARLLVADRDSDGPATIRLAHEALLSEWARARELIAEDAVMLGIRRAIEERRSRSREIGSAGSRLAGGDLSDAQRLLAGHREDLGADLVQYIEHSVRQDRSRRRRETLLWSATAALIATLVVGAGALAIIASERDASARFLAAERDTIDAQRDGDVAVLAGGAAAGIPKYEAAVREAQRMTRIAPSDPAGQFDLASAEASLAYVTAKRGGPGDHEAAVTAYQGALQASLSCAKPTIPQPWQGDCDTLAKQIRAAEPQPK